MTDFFHNTEVVLHTRDGFPVMAPEALKDKRYVFLFIGAQWSPACRAFTPKLKAFYERHHKTHNFEIIFVTRDGKEDDMETFHYCSQGEWLRLPFPTARTMLPVLQSSFDAKDIPTLLVFENATLDGKPRRLIAKCGVEMVLSDKDAEGFPWEGADLNVPKVRCLPLLTMPLVLVVLILVGLVVNIIYTVSSARKKRPELVAVSLTGE